MMLLINIPCLLHSMNVDKTLVQVNNPIPSCLQPPEDEFENARLYNYAMPPVFTKLIYNLKKDAQSKEFIAPAILLESPSEEQAQVSPRAFAETLNPNAQPYYHPEVNEYPNVQAKLGLLLIRNLKALFTYFVAKHNLINDTAAARLFVDYLKQVKRSDKVALVCGISFKASEELPVPIKNYFAQLDKGYMTTIAIPLIVDLERWKLLAQTTAKDKIFTTYNEFYIQDDDLGNTEFPTAKSYLYQQLLPFSNEQLADIVKVLPFKKGFAGKYLKYQTLNKTLKRLKKKLKIKDYNTNEKEITCIICKKTVTQYYGILPCCTTDNKPNIICNDCADQTMQIDEKIPSPCPNCKTIIAACFGMLYLKVEEKQNEVTL